LQVLQLIISGIAQGCIYGLIALGFVLIYKATETVSFAQGELMMLGAFLGLALMTVTGLPFWLAVLAAMAAMAVFGVAAERAVIRPILGQPAFSIVMLTFGIGYVARGAVTMIPAIGTETHTLPVPYKDQVWKLGELVLNVEQLVVIALTVVLCATAVRAVPLQQDRHRDAGQLAEPAGGLLHGHPGAAAQRPGLGPGGRRGGRGRACCWRPSPSCTPTWASSA
jgi:branched-subunit amino acid ABC-type transport system permease component